MNKRKKKQTKKNVDRLHYDKYDEIPVIKMVY